MSQLSLTGKSAFTRNKLEGPAMELMLLTTSLGSTTFLWRGQGYPPFLTSLTFTHVV